MLPPDIVLVALLPPLLYSAAVLHLAPRPAREHAPDLAAVRSASSRATTAGVAGARARVRSRPRRGPAAFVLGAIVSPTDPLAATAIARRLGVPRRIVAILEGESLVNDGTALVSTRRPSPLRVGHFSLWDAGGRLVLNVARRGRDRPRRRLRRPPGPPPVDDPPIEVALALLTGYLAYLPAAALGVSGVLAAVTVGSTWAGTRRELTTVETRLSGDAFWEILTFLLNALLFVLVGLQLRADPRPDRRALDTRRFGDAAIVALAVLAIRIVWVPSSPTCRAGFPPRAGARSVPAVAGARRSFPGPGSAAASRSPRRSPSSRPSLPRARSDRLPHLRRDSRHARRPGPDAAALIRARRSSDDGGAEREEAKARIKAAEAALERLDELVAEGVVREDTAERLRGAYGLPHRAASRARFDDGRRRSDRGAVGRATSGCAASYSMPNAVRSLRCAKPA